MTTIHWARYGQRSGWVHWGTRPWDTILPSDRSPWAKAVRVCCAAEGGHWDACNLYDAAIASAGPLGANLRFRTLDTLLGECVKEDAKRFAEHTTCFGWILGIIGVPPRLCMRTPQPDAEVDVWTELSDAERWFAVFSRGSNVGIKERDYAARLSRRWVESLVALLQDPTFDTAVMRASIGTVRSIARYVFDEQFGADIDESPQHMDADTLKLIAYGINHPSGARQLALDHYKSGFVGEYREVDDLVSRGTYGASGGDVFRERAARTKVAAEREVAR